MPLPLHGLRAAEETLHTGNNRSRNIGRTNHDQPRLRNNWMTLNFTGTKPPNPPTQTAAALSLISPPPSPWPSDVASAQDRKRRLLLWAFYSSWDPQCRITAFLWCRLAPTSTAIQVKFNLLYATFYFYSATFQRQFFLLLHFMYLRALNTL